MSNHTTPPSPSGVIHPPVAPAWTALSTAWTAQVQALTGRDDLTVLVTPGAGQGSPACITLDDGVIEIDATHVDVDPAKIDPTDPATRDLYPVGWGLAVHEIAHAEHSRWGNGNRNEPVAASMAVLLDEARIEGQRLRVAPADRQWLRASSLKLDLDDLQKPDSPRQAATVAAILLARADAGVLSHREVAPVRKAIVAVIGRRRLKRLEQVWQRALRTADGDAAAMHEWGRRWCRIMAMHHSIPFPFPIGGHSTLMAANAAVLVGIAAEVAEMTAAGWKALADAQQRANERAKELADRNRKKSAAEKIFGKKGVRLPRAQSGPTRPARDDERAAVSQLSRALRAAAYREPITSKKTSTLPPGRLAPRAAMAEQVQRQMGQIPTAEPWSSTARQSDPQPPLLVGITIDVSWSMGPFFGPSTSAAWIIAQAVSRLPGGMSASVTFGEHALALTQPGRRQPAEVRELRMENDTRGFPLTVDALDHALGLSTAGHAARLLVMITDGEFDGRETIEGQQRLDLLARAGCALLWIGPTNSTPLHGPEVVLLADPRQAGDIITKAATAALRARTA